MVLEIRNLRKSFRAPTGGMVAVVDVPEFRLGYGEQMALAGSSGSGKTTLLNLIAGILAADAGEIRIGVDDLTKFSEAARDRLRAVRIGYVFQNFNLLQSLTALENITVAMKFGRGVDTRLAAHLLERVGLKDRLHFRPAQLSIGQQQRVAVARAVANRPELVLADEPTGNLDRVHAAAALGLLRELCRETSAALLLVSHDPHVLDSFDRTADLKTINRARPIDDAEPAPIAPQAAILPPDTTAVDVPDPVVIDAPHPPPATGSAPPTSGSGSDSATKGGQE